MAHGDVAANVTTIDIESVPNFSEGRDPTLIARLGDTLRRPGVHVLDVHSDPVYHRSVFTVVGPPAPLTDALYDAVALAVREIDLRVHEGAHPRMGAADIVPFVPLDGASMQLCIDCATRLGGRIGKELGVPAYLYGRAARNADHEVVARLRRRQGEQWPRGVDPSVLGSTPDFGPARPHPAAGVVAIGARPFMIAFNIALATTDRKMAAHIANVVRTSKGGLPGVQARGFATPHHAHVSMNLYDLDATRPLDAFLEVERLATAAGHTIAYSEIVGLIPEAVLSDTPTERLRLVQPAEDCVVERRLAKARQGGGEV
jgi:glutamate formiminotransferase